MAGFFDTLFGSENEPDRRDYKRMDEITTPEELEAYRAGESATGSFIPGLDYARSMARGARREITDPSMGPLGERYQEEMDRYNRRQAEFERLQKLYPEAVRGGQLRGTENIPGAEAAFMAQPLAGGVASALTRGALRQAPQMVEREAVFAPEVGGNWPSLDTYNPGRTNKWRERVFKDPSLNPTRSMAQEMHPGEVVPESPTFTPAPARVNRAPSPVVQSYWDRLSDLPAATRNDLLLMRQTGQKPSDFRMNAINSALAKRGVSLSDILGETEGTLSPNVYGSMTKESLSGVPMNPRERAAAQAHIQTFRPATDADIGTRRMVRSPLASGMNEPDLQFSPTVNENIANRQAAQEAKNERFARLPPVLQTNAFYKQANRLLEGGDEVRDFWSQRLGGRGAFRNVAPDEVISGMGEASGYRPPEVVRRWGDKNTNLLPNRGADALNKALSVARNVDPRWGVGAGAAGASLLGAKMLRDQRDKRMLPDIDIRGARPATATNAPLPVPHPNMGPTMEEGPRKVVAETARETPVRGQRPVVRGPNHPAHVAPRHVAPARRAAPSNERYYGDWRDTEPFASDPIGGFIDELIGRRKAATTRGTEARRANLGDLLPFEKGGVVSGRRKFEDGGTDGIPILSDLGDRLGGLFGEGATAPVAQDRGEEPAGDVGMSPLKQALIAAGLGMMAASRPGTGVGEAIGAGGLKGFELYQSAQKLQSDLRQKELARQDRLREGRLISSVLGDDVGAPVASDEAKPATPIFDTKAAPISMPSAELPAPKDVSAIPPSVETTAPEDLKAPSGAPISPVKVVASDTGMSDASIDARIEKLRFQHGRIDKLLPHVTNSDYKAALGNHQRSIEFSIRDLREQKEKAAAERHAATTEQRLQEKEAREAFERTPEGIKQKVSAEEAAKNEPKIIESTEAAAASAKATTDQIDQVLEAYKTGDIHTSPSVLSFLKNAQSLGYELSAPVTDAIIDPKRIKNTEVLAGLGVSDLLKQIGGSLGHAISDADRAMIERIAAGVDKSPAANIERLNLLKKVLGRAQETRTFMQKYLDEHGSLDGNYQRELAKHFSDKNITGEASSRHPTKEEILQEIERRKQSNG